jgi:hypothetical protein
VRAIDALGVVTVNELRFSKFEFSPSIHSSMIEMPDARRLVAAVSATKRGRCGRGLGVPVGSNAAAQ